MATDGVTRARVLISRWVRDSIDGKISSKEDIKYPEIANAAVEHFLNDVDFMKGPIADLIRLAAYDAAQEYGKKTRGWVSFGDEMIKREEVTNRARRAPSFEIWLEHVMDREVNFLNMTKEDLLLAAQERRGRASKDLEIATLEETLAAKMETGQTVGDRFTVEEIEEVRQSLARQEALKEKFKYNL